MRTLAIIGGSGCYGLPHLCPFPMQPINTPYGYVNGLLCSVSTNADNTINEMGAGSEVNPVYFLPRHGNSHAIAPHKINYQANIWALKSLGVDTILALNAVGSMFHPPGTWFLPRQIIDYTYGRAHTFHDDFSQTISHIEFSDPLNINVINRLNSVLATTDLNYCDTGVYGCTQGPRLETAAEIQRLERDGCTLVGMTLMPEAALAAELAMDYASLCLSVNWAAGKCSTPITFEAIKNCLEEEYQRLSIYWPQIVHALTAADAGDITGNN